MKSFVYQAVDAQGQATSGTIDAADWLSAESQLAARGLQKIEPASARRPEKFPRLSQAEALELAYYIAELAKVGLPLGKGLRALAAETDSGRLPPAMRALAGRLEAGEPLETVVARVGSRMGAHGRDLILAGASSGQLPQTLDELLAHQRSMADLSTQFWQALAYPLTMFGFLVAWLLFVALWLIPSMQLDKLMADFGSSRPPDASRLIEFSRLFPKGLVAIAGGIIAVLVIARLVGGKPLVSRVLAQVPLFGRAWWYQGLVEFAGLMRLFLARRLSLPEALRLASISSRDPAIRAMCASAAGKVADGRPLAACLEGHALFPPTFVELVAWGERHSAMGDAFAGAREMFYDRLQLQLQLTRLIVPPIVFLAVVAAAVISLSSIVTPMIKLIQDLT